MNHPIKALQAAVKESGKDRCLLAFSFKPIPEGENGGCGTPINVVGTNGGKMPCGSILYRFGKAEPYYCSHCKPHMETKMTLDNIIAIADGVYPDGLVERAAKGEDVGDSLATFIAQELKSTFDPKASDYHKLVAARNAMSKAAAELTSVTKAFARVQEMI